MITVHEAEKLVRQHFPKPLMEQIPLEKSLQRILAEDVYAPRDLPPFNRVAMDGIAVNGTQLQGQEFSIEGVQGAGQAQLTLNNLQSGALEVMTGAPLPKNCTMVIPYENIHIANQTATLLDAAEKIVPLRNVHAQGSDLKSGGKVLSRGQKINSTVIGILASQGLAAVKVQRLPKIAIVVTGNELVDLQSTPKPHEIFISNNYSLMSELRSFGLDNLQFVHLADDREHLFHQLKGLIEEFDIILLTGGVSKGKFDYVPQVLSDLKVKKVFHKVAQRPGKPLWFGVGEQEQMVFGLPGNPVSCLVNLRKYLIPGLINETPMSIKLPANLQFAPAMTFFLPVRLNIQQGDMYGVPIVTNGSGDYLSLQASTGFVQLAAQQENVQGEELFPYYPWGKTC